MLIPKFMREILSTGKFDHNCESCELSTTVSTDGGRVRTSVRVKECRYLILGVRGSDELTTVTGMRIIAEEMTVDIRMDNGLIRHPVLPCVTFREFVLGDTKRRLEYRAPQLEVMAYYSLDGCHFFETYEECVNMLSASEREDLLIERIRYDT